MRILLSILGHFMAFIPRAMASGICRAVGFLIIYFPNSRARVAFANIKHCFPNLEKRQVRRIAYESAKRMVEMGLFVLASPYIPEAELKKRIKISPYLNGEIEKIAAAPRPIILMIPHFCMMESITMLPMLSPIKMPPTGVFYRPFDNAGLEKWVKQTRQRYGIHLLSRKESLFAANDFLKNNGCVGVLFDQDAGMAGALAPFFGRLASTSEIAELMAERLKCKIGIIWAKRTGFWSAEIDAQYFGGETAEEMLFNSNKWLEDKLKTDETARLDWLWLHKRWKTQTTPKYRFQIRHRRVIFEEYIRHFNLKELPRKSDFLFEMPKSLADCVSILPVFAAIRRARPDARITLLLAAENAGALEGIEIAERIVALPAEPKRRAEILESLAGEYPELCAVLENSELALSDAKKIAAAQTYGFVFKGEKKPRRIKFCAELEPEMREMPKIKILEKFLQKYGLKEPLDFSPIAFKNRENAGVFDAKSLEKFADCSEISAALKSCSKIEY
ncbi:MAG: hypothetical protein IKO42_05240 [Opitutales bacterium]|nr:hypothetical protein [Opitutales bacterium]